MKQMPFITIIIIFCLLFAGCVPKSFDGPPDPGTPEPPPHNGSFISDYGTMTFNGDGKTVYIDFSPEFLEVLDNPPNEETYEYAFLWYNFGLCRYDTASEFKIYNESSEISLTFSLYLEGKGTTEDKIAFSYPTPEDKNVFFRRK